MDEEMLPSQDSSGLACPAATRPTMSVGAIPYSDVSTKASVQKSK